MATAPLNWDRLKEVVADAIDAPADRREAVLIAACAADASLASEARKLLAAHDDSSEVVIDRRTDPWLGLGGPDVLSLGGQRIGRYELVRVIGEGAMSAVYLARQASPARPVAIKLLRTALPVVDARLRFRREAQALARLKHPNIAVIYEAGLHETRDGSAIPFIAMEYVDGVPLTTFAAARRLDRAGRIELMIVVAQAVQAAHQQAIIHRDLKPANVLVDAEGRPKVLDFGIARIASLDADRDTERATWQTTAGLLLGTPGYMSPEQCAPGIDAVDVRSDVWSLGVMLYELLLGRLPIETRGASLADVLRKLETSQPTLPRSLDPSLPRDLETVLLTAVCRDKHRRYASAQAFADDLQRFLRALPIQARPPTTIYLLGTFARRNKGLLLAVAATITLLAAATTVSSVGFFRARRSLARAVTAEAASAAERDHAVAAERQSASVVQFLLEVLRSPDPARDGRSVTVIERIKASLPTIADRFRDAPAAEAQVTAAIGRTLFELGEYDLARAQTERAIALSAPLAGASSRAVLRLRVQCLEIVRWQYRYAEAKAMADALLADALAALPRDDADVLTILSNLTGIDVELERFDVAVREYEEVLATRRRVEGDDGDQTIVTMGNLGNAYMMNDRLDDAMRVLGEAVRRGDAKWGADSAATIVTQFNVAQCLAWKGRPADALPLFQANLARSLKAYGPGHDHTLIVRRALGEALAELGRVDEALAELTGTVDASQASFGPGHELTLRARNARAVLLDKMGRHGEATADYRDLLAAMDRGGSPASTRRSTRQNLALSLLAAGRPADALEEADRVIADEAQGPLTTAYDAAATLSIRAGALFDLARFTEARAGYAQAMAGFDPAKHPLEAAVARRGIGRTYTAEHRYADAERELLAAVAVIRPDQDARKNRRTVQAMCELYAAWDKPHQAAPWRSMFASTQPSVP